MFVDNNTMNISENVIGKMLTFGMTFEATKGKRSTS
jgi:hypothetical protein